VIGAAHVVAQQRGRLVQIHDQDIDVAIVIEIAEGHAAAGMRLGDAGPRQVAQFFEFAVSQIAKNHAGRFVGRVGRLLLHFGIDHAGGEEQVGKAVVVQVHDAGAPADVARFHTQARADGDVAEIALAVVAVEHVGVAAKMRLEDIQVSVGIEVSKGQAHARLFLPVLAQRHAGFQALLGEGAVAIVVEEQAGRGVARHVNIGPAVAIEIGRHRGQAIARLHGGDAGFLAHVGERAVAVVVVEAATLLRQAARPAVDRHAEIAAARIFPAHRHLSAGRTPGNGRRRDPACRRDRNRSTCSPCRSGFPGESGRPWP
jgi:hypothetical protein